MVKFSKKGLTRVNKYTKLIFKMTNTNNKGDNKMNQLNFDNDYTFLPYPDDKLYCEHCGKHITVIDWQVAPYCSSACEADAEFLQMDWN